MEAAPEEAPGRSSQFLKQSATREQREGKASVWPSLNLFEQPGKKTKHSDTWGCEAMTVQQH